ncbi:MAG TPA: cation:proton antiporter, partial [Bacillota bacterium]|nr:cation:proton antiporter [Bacillota bacterium]
MNLQVLFYAGILLITGLLFGKLAKLAHLPNVTGYLVGGLLIGPSVLGILSENAVSSMGLVSNIALGFIAFSIGNELKFSYFKKVGTGPIVIAVFESMLAVLVVFAATLVYFGIVGQFNLTNIRFALVLAAIAAATAPPMGR